MKGERRSNVKNRLEEMRVEKLEVKKDFEESFFDKVKKCLKECTEYIPCYNKCKKYILPKDDGKVYNMYELNQTGLISLFMII